MIWLCHDIPFIYDMLVIVSMLFCFVLCLVSASISNVTANINNVQMLNGTNFKAWKENVEIVLGCMDVDLALRTEWPTLTEDSFNEARVKRWDRSNRMSLKIMVHFIPEAIKGSIIEKENAKKFLE